MQQWTLGHPPPKYKPHEDESTFWALSGQAKFLALSRGHQEVINREVFKEYGYYMPYVPLRIHQEVDDHLDAWIQKDILGNQNLEPSMLQHYAKDTPATND
ncbi:hypothetical protein XELAEV_18029342mg [Xenopus laevis]|uniref:Uncharacterized protein n=1 Tax=Xenopus laevis TaxID=8355 RepID=A0A974CRB7_XENLA|nr:hypothetical protein XELAEV_18029342mg [Xenopus laevis]